MCLCCWFNYVMGKLSATDDSSRYAGQTAYWLQKRQRLWEMSQTAAIGGIVSQQTDVNILYRSVVGQFRASEAIDFKVKF